MMDLMSLLQSLLGLLRFLAAIEYAKDDADVAVNSVVHGIWEASGE